MPAAAPSAARHFRFVSDPLHCTTSQRGSIPLAGPRQYGAQRPGPAAPCGRRNLRTDRLDQPEDRSLPFTTTIAAGTAEVSAGPLIWAGLLAFLAAMVVVDLRVGASGEAMTTRRAATWSVIWLGLALTFGAGLWVFAGNEAGESYIAGYVMEKALSLDNVFVFTLIF